MIEFLVWLALTAATIIPMMKLLPHFGLDAKWAFVCVFPLATLVLLWIMATKLQSMEKR
jgi:membrane protein implicated in regulation of membrane protease activity